MHIIAKCRLNDFVKCCVKWLRYASKQCEHLNSDKRAPRASVNYRDHSKPTSLLINYHLLRELNLHSLAIETFAIVCMSTTIYKNSDNSNNPATY